MSFARYPEYKDSGVEWLGEVPGHWEVKRLKRNMRLLTEKTDRRDHPVALENIEGWTGRFITTDTEFQGEGIAFEPDDILFGKLRPYLAKAYRAEFSGEAVGDFHVMRPVTGINSRFVQYQILNRGFISIVDGSTFGSKMPRASWEFVGDMVVTSPPLTEQTQIAAFLDRETAKIDGLVAEQRRLMALLKEKRQAVISYAVTQGLNPLAPMKPSGIEWLGDVPEHWEVMSLRRCSLRVQTGGTPSSEPPSADIEDGLVWYTPGDFGDSLRLTLSDRKIPRSAAASGEAKVFPPGSALIVSIGATLGKVGFAEAASSGNQQINAVIPNSRIEGYFLTYSLLVKTEVMRFLSNASTIGIMNQEKTKEIWLSVPPRQEQDAITAYLDTESAKFDTLTLETQRAIDLLADRRTALISAAVTGQIDVRERT
jgi:type I restriction enzyme S subunit